MAALQEQWDELLDLEPDDWSFLDLELTLDDPERMEEAALWLCALNPWHGETWRTGRLRFRSARTSGYGADPGVARSMLRRLDDGNLGGTLRVLRSLDGVRLVQTQGPT
jgi:hypothetical protein